MNDNKALFGVGESLDRAENSAAIVGSVARVYINVKRAKAERTVIARGVAKGQNLFSAVLADKALVVFSKTLIFHNYLPFTLLIK